MKKILLTLSLLFCFIHSNGWSETINDLIVRDGLYYKKFTDVPFTGKVTGKKQGQLKNGLKEGLWNYYHDNGQLHERGNYQKNLKVGNWVSYTKEGELVYKGSFNQGLKQGDWIESRDWMNYSKFFLFQDYSSHKNGILDGPYKKICRNGNLRLEGTYKDGKTEGKWTEYGCSGSLWEITNYKNGLLNGPYRRYNDYGTTKGNYKNNKKEGEWIVYNYSLKMKSGYIDKDRSGTFKNGKKISDYKD
jgi:antitoxin component YwqK of YwqJK toxin-antitoxin module